jgi:FkbM family methyltransferase
MEQDLTGTFIGSLVILFNKGLRYSTVIDLGCADGSFFLHLAPTNLFQGAVPFNVDANPIYENSLKEISEVVGGAYAIAAIADQAGEVEMTMATHPYWGSLRPEGDLYWDRIRGQRGEQKIKVPAATLDQLVTQFDLKPPFLLKLDLQGSEVAALRGAKHVLANTDAIVCEADTADFSDIHQAVTEAGFVLFDLTHISRTVDHTLGWFHPVYINRRHERLRGHAFWDAAETANVIDTQIKRRETMLVQNKTILAHLRAQRPR